MAARKKNIKGRRTSQSVPRNSKAKTTAKAVAKRTKPAKKSAVAKRTKPASRAVIGKKKTAAKSKAIAKKGGSSKRKVATKRKAAAKTKAVTKRSTSAKTKAVKPVAASAKPVAKRKTAAKKPSVRTAVAETNGKLLRRDPTGHLNPRYAADLRAKSRETAAERESATAFLDKAYSEDTLAEELGEEAVITMTSGEDQSSRMQDLETEEESGGPFVETTGQDEFAHGTDTSNPFDGTREPFPTT